MTSEPGDAEVRTTAEEWNPSLVAGIAELCGAEEEGGEGEGVAEVGSGELPFGRLSDGS